MSARDGSTSPTLRRCRMALNEPGCCGPAFARGCASRCGAAANGSAFSRSTRCSGRWRDGDIALLRTAAEIFANAIERARTETEQEALEARLAQAQRLEAVGTLAGGIAHEFNNILGAILGYAETGARSICREYPPASPANPEGGGTREGRRRQGAHFQPPPRAGAPRQSSFNQSSPRHWISSAPRFPRPSRFGRPRCRGAPRSGATRPSCSRS